MFRKLFTGFLFFSLVTLHAQEAQFRIIGYVPNWINVESFATKFDYSLVTHLNYAFQNPDANGNLYESNNGLTTLVSKAHENNVKVLISIGGGAAADGAVKTNFQNLIKTEESRAGFIHKIMEYARKYKLDGVDVDEEGPAINSDYGPFISQLHDSLTAAGLYMTAAVGWGGDQIDNAVLPLFDWVCIMAYDLTGPWSGEGQHSPYSYAVSTIEHWLGRGVKKENLVLGLPFYGYDFSKKESYIAYKDIIARYPNAFKTDKVEKIYYNGMPTIQKKTLLAMEKVSGVMIWELSQDVAGKKSLLNVIRNTVDSVVIYIDSIELVYVKQALDNANELFVIPNPASEYIEVALNSQSSGKYVITNQMGQVVLSGSTCGKNARIDVCTLPGGIYFIKLLQADNERWQKFVVR